MHGVTTRPIRVTRAAERSAAVHEVRHPLPAELLVAEFAGELPPEVAQVVRQHVAVCESCGARAQALAEPYEILADLGQEPVAYVPDLRHPVRLQLEKERFRTSFLRAAGVVGRGGLATIAAMCGLALLIALVVATSALQRAVPQGHSGNTVAQVPQAGAQGVLYAATAKVLQVQSGSGQSWPVAEVIVVDEATGHVLRSMPANGSDPRMGQATDLPTAVVLAPDGGTLYQLTNPAAGEQALIALDVHTGQVLFARALTLPDGSRLPQGTEALALAIAPNGQHVYISLSLGQDSPAAPRILVLSGGDASIASVWAPGLDVVVPEPSAGGSLPDVPTQTPVRYLVTTGLRPTLAAGGALAISPDGYWLFDALAFVDEEGNRAVVVRRISAVDGTTAQALALPGDFAFSALAASANPLQPLLYLARGGPDGQLYILRMMPAGPALAGQIPLGGPAAKPGRVFTGGIALSPTRDGARVYVSDDLVADDNQAGSHDIWLVDGAAATIVSHRVGLLAPVGQASANWAGGNQGKVFVVLNGQVLLLPANLALDGPPPLWLSLTDGMSIWRLVGTGT